MSQEKSTGAGIPAPFRGLRVLLLDNDTTSLLQIASQLEQFSYTVTTTELAEVALSILKEREDQFDLVMADANMHEMNFSNFIKTIRFIKDFPIIFMYSELNKDMMEEAMEKGECFFMKKPISSKNLQNLWQHVYRKSKLKSIRSSNADDQEVESREINVRENRLDKPENEHVGENHVDGEKSTRLSKSCTKRAISAESEERGEFKRKRTEEKSTMLEASSYANSCYEEFLCSTPSYNPGVNNSLETHVNQHKQIEKSPELDEFQALTDFSPFPAAFLKLFPETEATKELNSQSKFSTRVANVNQKLDFSTADQPYSKLDLTDLIEKP